jgi:hypothetical protein
MAICPRRPKDGGDGGGDEGAGGFVISTGKTTASGAGEWTAGGAGAEAVGAARGASVAATRRPSAHPHR